MPPRKKNTPASRKAPVKHFTFQLSLHGVAGIALVTSCLFLWMFFLGIWAGKTILSPCPSPALVPYASGEEKKQEKREDAYLETASLSSEEIAVPEIWVQPRERKKRISPP